MNEAAQRMIKVLAAPARSGQPVDVWRLFGELTMDVVGTTAFGVDFHTQDAAEGGASARSEEASSLVQAAKVFFGTQGPGALPWLCRAPFLPSVIGSRGSLCTGSINSMHHCCAAIMDNIHALFLFMFPFASSYIRRVANLLPTKMYTEALRVRMPASDRCAALTEPTARCGMVSAATCVKAMWYAHSGAEGDEEDDELGRAPPRLRGPSPGREWPAGRDR